MKDRYLFKAKRINNGEWVEGFVARPFSRNAEGNITNYCFNALDEMGFVSECIVSDDTICQYTGLTDKDGNKIWENDIVKRYTSSGDEWRISKIVWADYSLNMGWCIEDVKSLAITSSRLFSVGFDVNDTKKCEVIGNIFDNSELLKGE